MPERVFVQIFVLLDRRQEALVRSVVVRKWVLLVQHFLPDLSGHRIVVRKSVLLAAAAAFDRLRSGFGMFQAVRQFPGPANVAVVKMNVGFVVAAKSRHPKNIINNLQFL